MRAARRSRLAGCAPLLLLVNLQGAQVDAQCSAPSGADPGCAGYVYPESSAASDVKMLCDMMPGMMGCELSKECDEAPCGGFCHPLSLLADICAANKGNMGGMHGCSTYNTLCEGIGLGFNPSNSTVRECRSAGAPVPHFVTSRAAREATVSMCSSMPGMQGCTSCADTPNPRPRLAAAQPSPLSAGCLVLTRSPVCSQATRAPTAAARRRSPA